MSGQTVNVNTVQRNFLLTDTSLLKKTSLLDTSLSKKTSINYISFGPRLAASIPLDLNKDSTCQS